MKKLAYIAATVALSIAAYAVGYKQGGEDFAYLDHMMIGMLSNSEVLRCEQDKDPHSCYKWSEELSIGHAFIFYTQHNEKLSPISQYIFPESYEGYLKAVSNLYTLATEISHEKLCNYARDLGKKSLMSVSKKLFSS